MPSFLLCQFTLVLLERPLGGIGISSKLPVVDDMILEVHLLCKAHSPVFGKIEL